MRRIQPTGTTEAGAIGPIWRDGLPFLGRGGLTATPICMYTNIVIYIYTYIYIYIYIYLGSAFPVRGTFSTNS